MTEEVKQEATDGQRILNIVGTISDAVNDVSLLDAYAAISIIKQQMYNQILTGVGTAQAQQMAVEAAKAAAESPVTTDSAPATEADAEVGAEATEDANAVTQEESQGESEAEAPAEATEGTEAA